MAYTKFTGWESTTLPKKMRAALANMEDGIQQGIDAAASAQTTANNALPKAGGSMSGSIDMNNNKITELAAPTATTDAANKSYVDSGDSANATAAANAASAAAAAQTTANNALPKSGGTMSGAINMGTKKITNLGAPTADADAATKKYVDDQAAATSSQMGSYLPLAGGTMSGPIDMGSKKITAVPTPQANTDAANKKYVDDTVSPVSSVANSAASTASAANTAAANAQSDINTHKADNTVHVSYSTTNPVMDGTANPGTATTVARSDHKHPTDTSRQAAITGAASTITSSNLTASRALISNSSGKVAVSSVTSTELGYVSGVTSAIQTQLNTLSSEIANLENDINSGSVAVDPTLSVEGMAADAKATGDAITQLSTEKASSGTVPVRAAVDPMGCASFLNEDGIVLFTLDLAGLSTVVYSDLVISKSDMRIDEGRCAYFTVKLASCPSTTQPVYIAVSDPDRISVNPPVLQFTSSNYSLPQEVCVQTSNDKDTADNLVKINITSRIVSPKDIDIRIVDKGEPKIVTDGLILHADYSSWDGVNDKIVEPASGVTLYGLSNFTKTANGIVGSGVLYKYLTLDRSNEGYENFVKNYNNNAGIALEHFGNVFDNFIIYGVNGNHYTKALEITNLSVDSVYSGGSSLSFRWPYIDADGYVQEWYKHDFCKILKEIDYSSEFWHLVLNMWPDGSIEVYQNGVQIYKTTVENFGSWPTLPYPEDGSQPIGWITALTGSSDRGYMFNQNDKYPGFVKSHKIYNRCLSKEEIIQNMHAEAHSLGIESFRFVPSQLMLEPGDKIDIIFNTVPIYHLVDDLEVLSSSGCVNVDDFMITACEGGVAELTASASYNYEDLSCSAIVNVSDIAYDISSTREVNEIALTRIPESSLEVGDEFACQAYLMSNITPEHPYPYSYYDDNLVKYSSSDTSVCRVKNGVLTAISEGSCTITVSDKSETITKSFDVSVVYPTIHEYKDDAIWVVRESSYDWTTSESSTLALIDIMSRACSENKSRVVLPCRSYTISPKYGSIYIPTNTTVDFQNSVIQIEPSDMTSTGYVMFYMKDVEYSVIENVTIYGERLLIDGTGSEGCRAISIEGRSYRSGLQNCTVSRSPGFNISWGNTNRRVAAVKLSGILEGGLDDSGQELEESYAFRSDYVDIRNVSNSKGQIWLGNVQGYGGYVYMSARVYNIYFYDADKQFLSMLHNCVQYYAIQKPENAVYARIVFWWSEAPTSSDPDYGAIAHIHSFDKPDRCFYRNCLFEDNYSLEKSTNGGENMLIENCKFRNNGYRDPSSHLDWEDGRQHNKGHIVRNCSFEGGGGVSIIGADGLVMHNNTFNNVKINCTSEVQNTRMWLNRFMGSKCAVSLTTKTDMVFSQNILSKGATYQIVDPVDVSFKIREAENIVD